MSRNPTQAHPQMPPTQLEPEERRVLAECERESLMYRSIPLGLVTFFATQYAMSRNIISSGGKWVKLSAALFTGYILGKVSYASICRQKILTQIPESNLAHAIRGDFQQIASATSSSSPSSSYSDQSEQQSFMPKRSKDPSEAVVFVPDPVELDTHTVPVGVNQYGDPIYDVRK